VVSAGCSSGKMVRSARMTRSRRYSVISMTFLSKGSGAEFNRAGESGCRNLDSGWG
jgi:hypothetical protein